MIVSVSVTHDTIKRLLDMMEEFDLSFDQAIWKAIMEFSIKSENLETGDRVLNQASKTCSSLNEKLIETKRHLQYELEVWSRKYDKLKTKFMDTSSELWEVQEELKETESFLEHLYSVLSRSEERTKALEERLAAISKLLNG